MSDKLGKSSVNDDPILQAFNETKGEQLDLLDMTPKEQPRKTKKTTQKAKAKSTVEVVEDTQLNEKVQEETQEVIYTGADGIKYTEEEWFAPVVKNGPSRQEVEEWKERYGNVYFTPFEGDIFVWRTLQRPEYREIIRDTTLNALDREEFFTEKCVLFPRNFSIEKIKKSRAGIASLLSEMIMDKSGFVAQSAPIKL